jgi:hypothetical protein
MHQMAAQKVEQPVEIIKDTAGFFVHQPVAAAQPQQP